MFYGLIKPKQSSFDISRAGVGDEIAYLEGRDGEYAAVVAKIN